MHVVDEEKRSVTCSCGKVFNQCIFWGEIDKKISNRNNLTLCEAYQIIFETFEQVFGKQYLLLDSSKLLRTLKKIITIENIEIKVVFLIKDVRSFTVSQTDAIKRIHGKGTLKALFHNSIYFFLIWYFNNILYRYFFKKNSIPFIQIGYEELCLYPDHILPKICDFLEIQMDDNMLNINNSKSHVFRGNRMRSQKDKHKLMYDNRWFARNQLILPSALFPFILHYNAKQVYSNDASQIWKK